MKTNIITALAALLALASVAQAADAGKRVAEFPAKEVVVRRAAPADVPADAGNPKVSPGLVIWHASFEDACAAAKKSGKMVMHFQLLGLLDNRFC